MFLFVDLHPEVWDLSTSDTDESKSGTRELREHLHVVNDPRNPKQLDLRVRFSIKLSSLQNSGTMISSVNLAVDV